MALPCDHALCGSGGEGSSVSVSRPRSVRVWRSGGEGVSVSVSRPRSVRVWRSGGESLEGLAVRG